MKTKRLTKTNTHLLAFAAGVCVAAAFAQLGMWGMARSWEIEAMEHGCGVLQFKADDKPAWDGNQPLIFYWNDKNPKTQQPKELSL